MSGLPKFFFFFFTFMRKRSIQYKKKKKLALQSSQNVYTSFYIVRTLGYPTKRRFLKDYAHGVE